MKLNYFESSLVIIGDWNPHMINPVWIDQYLREPIPYGNQSTVKLGVHMNLPSVAVDGIKVILAGNRLQLHLDTGTDFALIEKYAQKIFRLLPSTMISGYGVNFQFYGEETGIPNILNTQFFGELNSNLSSKQCAITFNLDEIIMTISHNENPNDNISGIAFNFHFNVDRLSEVESLLSRYPLSNLKDKAIRVLSDVYRLGVEV